MEGPATSRRSHPDARCPVRPGTLKLINNPLAVQRVRSAIETLDGTLRQIRTIILDLDTSGEGV